MPYDYERHLEVVAEKNRKISAAGRDIGSIPAIKNIERRQSCRNSLRKFCLTYNPTPFYRPFSPDHLDAIKRLEEAAFAGALYAFAMPRGNGKTLLCRLAALWAASYGYRRYSFLIGATAGKGQDNLDAIKKYIRFLPLYAEDFPEIAYPATQLAGIALKATGQICRGEPTLIEWSKERIIFPTVPPPPNWPKEWPLRSDGRVLTSGTVLGAAGLTGDGIRGSVITLDTGESLRPDYVLLDDPQTPESAASPTQNETRLRLVNEDILGLAGPGESISAVMPCTVILPDDMVDRLLDRKKNPLWRGQRTKLLKSMPTNMAAWDNYFDIYQSCALKVPPELQEDEYANPAEASTKINAAAYAEANAYYEANREELDAGAEASWPERKLGWEISAIQHAMNLYVLSPRAFWSNYQNEPLPLIEAGDLEQLSAEPIAYRLSNRQRGLLPFWATTLTAHIDIHDSLLYWSAVAWGEGFGGWVVDYGTWPEQSRTWFMLRDAEPTLQKATGLADAQQAIYRGLSQLTEHLCGRAWPVDEGPPLSMARCLIDVGYNSEVIQRFASSSLHRAVLLPSKGFGLTAAKSPIEEWARKPGERRGLAWVVRPLIGGRAVFFDANFWKTHLAERLLVPLEAKSALKIFGDKPIMHRLFSEHLSSEHRKPDETPGRRVQLWQPLPGRDNHWWDTVVGNCVAASIQGISLLTGADPVKKKPVNVAALQEAAKERLAQRGTSAAAEEARRRREAFEARRRT